MSDWRTVQEVNGGINSQMQYMRAVAEYLNKYKKEQGDELYWDSEVVGSLDDVLNRIEQQMQVLSQGYLDSGYRYDDHDPRNLMDMYDDNYEYRSRARNGTTAREEMIAEITRQVAANDFEDTMNTVFATVPGLSEHMSEMSDIWSEDVWDYSDDDHAY